VKALCPAFAAARRKFGTLADGAERFGHPLIVGPWDEALADGGAGLVHCIISRRRPRRFVALSGTFQGLPLTVNSVEILNLCIKSKF